MGLSPRGLQESLAEPQHIEPYGGEDVPQVHPSAADVAGPSQAHAACLARNRPFDAGPAGIRRLKCLRGFPLPGRLEGLILRLGPDGERAPGVALLRADALGDVVAAPAIAARELHLDDGIPAIIKSRLPPDIGLAGGTGRVPLAPIHLEVLGIKAIPCAGLPLIIETGGPQEIRAIVLRTLDQQLGVQKAGPHLDRATGPPQANSCHPSTAGYCDSAPAPAHRARGERPPTRARASRPCA